MKTAIKISDMMESTRVKVFELTPNIPIEKHEQCQSCGNSLRNVCNFVSEKHRSKIRYGLCTNCGYMGYMDRPSETWMINFYSKDWDKSFRKSEADILSGTILPEEGAKQERYAVACLYKKINADKNKTFCEIGSGYGEVLKYFKNEGFKTVVGVENSSHRAELVSKTLGVNVFQGAFEGENVQKELDRLKPIGLFYSCHVLEHVYDPGDVLKRISSLQNIGDHLLLSLPDAAGEHINYALFYLVHLHSFTKESLEMLLNKGGYEIVADNSPDVANIAIAARKVENPKPIFKKSDNYMEEFVRRVNRGLSTDKLNGQLQELYWSHNKDVDFSEIVADRSSPTGKISWHLSKIIWKIKNKLHRFGNGYSMLVSTGENNDGVPFEIKFKENIKFLIK